MASLPLKDGYFRYGIADIDTKVSTMKTEQICLFSLAIKPK